MDHYAYPSIFEFVEKHNRYSDWEAAQGKAYYSGLSSQQEEIGAALAGRRWLKRTARRLPAAHWLRFGFHYVVKLGFLDGVAGFVLCHLLAEYEFLIWVKRRELSVLRAPSCKA